MPQFHKNWMEFFFIALVVIGVLAALLSPSAAISYAIAFLAGMFAGRLFYEERNRIRFPYIIIMAGFAIGYLIGVYYGSRTIVIVLFVVGATLSYKLYEKKIIRDTRF